VGGAAAAVEAAAGSVELGAEAAEAPARPVRRLQPQAEHAMYCFSHPRWKNADDRLLHFYDEKVRAIQDKAGDTEHVPISGNLYMYRSVAKFGDESGLFQDPMEWQVKLGLWIVITVQTVGPPCILAWAWHNIDFSENIIGFTEWDWRKGLSSVSQRLLGVLFLVLFILNGSYALATDREETEKMVRMCKVFDRASKRTKFDDAHAPWPPPEPFWLWLGAFINSFCLISCAFCMFLLFVIAEDGPKDVLFDAFGLTFLYNLDDVGGDLGFLDSKWDADQMGDIYGVLAEQTQLMDEIDSERQKEWTPDNVYQIAQILAKLLLFCLPLAFVVIEMKPAEEDNYQYSALLASVTAQGARLSALEAALQRQ